MAITVAPPAQTSLRPDKRFNITATVVTVASDTAVIVISALIALFMRNRLPLFADSNEDYYGLVVPLIALFAAMWQAALWLAGAYRWRSRGSGTAEYRLVFNASLATAAAVGVGSYLTHYPLSRGFFVLFFVSGAVLLLIGRHLLRRWEHHLHRKGFGLSRVLISGDELHVRELIDVLSREQWLGYVVAGVLMTDLPDDELPGGISYVGRPEDALRAIDDTSAHLVIFTNGSFASSAAFARLVRQFEDRDVQLVMVPGLSQVSAQRVAIRPVAGLPLVYVDQPRVQQASQWAKRLFDIMGAAALIVLLSPVLAVCALVVKLGDGGPILFRQMRIGKGSEPFSMLKFRSMVVDAEDRLAEVAQAPRTEGNVVMYKSANDPRITRFGTVLRRFSLDELPQLFNVLWGDMSLVGPRPALAREVNLYDDEARRRLDVRPGMTGLWQVSGRSDLSWEDTVRLDVYYVDNWTMIQDVSILIKTFRAVVDASGAY